MRKPPGESRPLSTILALSRDPLGFLERTAARHGDLAHLRVGPYRLGFVNHPDLFHEVFNEPERQEVLTLLLGWLDKLPALQRKANPP